MLDQDNNFYLIHLSILITYLLDSEWILSGEDTCYSPLGVKGLTKRFDVAVRLLSDRTQMTSKLRPNLKLLFFVIALLFFTKIFFPLAKSFWSVFKKVRDMHHQRLALSKDWGLVILFLEAFGILLHLLVTRA